MVARAAALVCFAASLFRAYARAGALVVWPWACLAAPCESLAQNDSRPELVRTDAAPRPRTYGELTREIELRRRDLEELNVSVGDRALTPAELERRRMLSLEIDRLDAQRGRLEQGEAVTENDDSVGARWSRFRASFRDITSWDVRDGMFRFQVGVRAQLDATYGLEDDSIEDALGSIDDGVRLRRARVFAKGRLLRAMDFWVELDVGEDAGLKNAYIDGARLSGWISEHFRWRIGKFQEPFSIGRMTSSNYTGFMEIGLPADTFAPGRNVGLMLRHAESNERLTWAASLTTNGGSTADNPNNSKLTFTGRATGIPVLFEDHSGFVHVGISISDRRPTSDDIRYRARPEARFAPVYADTGLIASDRTSLLGVELAIVKGSNWLQGEWIRASLNASAVGNPSLDGSYLEMGRFLTGEQRAYDRSEGTVDRVTPHTIYRGGNPFRSNGSRGALEVTARYSTVDLTDAAIAGGTMHDVTLGLNWYINAESRVMLNYVHSNLHGAGNTDIVLLRFQYNP